MFWNICTKKIVFFRSTKFQLSRTWYFRNANQWYQITSWFGDSIQKYAGSKGAALHQSGVWGWSSLTRNIFENLGAKKFVLTRSKWISEDSEKMKKDSLIFFVKIFFTNNFFFWFLSIFWNFCRSEFEWNRSWLIFFCLKSPEPWNENFVELNN